MSAVVTVLAAILGALLKWTGIFFAYRTGVRSERQHEAEAAGKIKDEQLEIAARPVEHRSDIIDRLRNKGL